MHITALFLCIFNQFVSWLFNQFCNFCQNTIQLYLTLSLSLYSLFPRRTEGKHFFVFFPPRGLFSLLARWLDWVEEHYSCHTQHRSTGHCPTPLPGLLEWDTTRLPPVMPQRKLGTLGRAMVWWLYCVRVCLYIVTFTTNTSVFLLTQAVTVVKTEEETNQTSGASVFVNCLQVSLHLFYLHAFLRIVFSGDCFLVLLYFSLGYL